MKRVSSFFPAIRENKRTLEKDIQRAIDHDAPHEIDFYALNLPKLRNYVGHGDIIDVGANLGWSIISFRKIGILNQVFAFEPNPTLFSVLRKVAKNQKRCIIYKLALGDFEGKQFLHQPTIDGKIYHQESSLDRDSFKALPVVKRFSTYGTQVNFTKFSVKTVKLDRLNLEPKFIKIDVEGTESKVLQGGLRTIKRSQPIIMLEASDPMRLEILVTLGYTRYYFDKNNNKLTKDETSFNEIWIPAMLENI